MSSNESKIYICSKNNVKLPDTVYYFTGNFGALHSNTVYPPLWSWRKELAATFARPDIANSVIDYIKNQNLTSNSHEDTREYDFFIQIEDEN